MRAPKKTSAHTGARVVELHRPHDTRDRVLQVAQTLFAERGFRGTSLRDIARRIGIQAPSLLHHFPSKQQLYLAVLDRLFEGMEDAAGALLIGRDTYQQRMRTAISAAIDYIAHRPDTVRILWQEMSDESGVGRQLLKRRIPPLNSMAVNFIFSGQREGQFRAEIDPFHFLLSLNSITLAYFTTAAMVRRLWNVNMLEPELIERRKREVIDMVERTLFTAVPESAPN